MEKLIIGEDNICPVTKLLCDDECCSPGSECNISGGGTWIKDDIQLSKAEMKMMCEYPDCHTYEGQDYYRKYRWMKKLLGIDKEWRDEPIYLCKKHKGNHKPI